MHPPLELCVDARAVYDAVAAADVCEFAGGSLEFHLISVRGRMVHAFIRKLSWVDTRDVLDDGQINGGVDRLLLHNANDICKHQAMHDALVHRKNLVGSVTMLPAKDAPPEKAE